MPSVFGRATVPKLVSMWPHMMVRRDHAAVCLLPPVYPTNIPSDTTGDDILGATLLKEVPTSYPAAQLST